MIEIENREESREGKDKSTAINHEYIDSGAYKRKFDNISDNHELNKTLYQCAKKMLIHRSGTHFEDMYWIDGETGKIVAQITDMTEPSRVFYKPSFIRRLKYVGKLVTIHNHPNSLPPSLGDYESAYRNGYNMSAVVCHDGKVFVYKNIGKPDGELYDTLTNEYIAMRYSEYTAEKSALEYMSSLGLLILKEV